MSNQPTPQFEQTDNVKFLVDDVPYTIARDVLTKYSESYFCQLLSNTSGSSNHELSIKGRDQMSAELFIYIYEYLRYGCLPRDFDGECLLLKEALPILRKEAVFYNIKPLIDEIDDEMNGGVKRLKQKAKKQKAKEVIKPVEHFALTGHALLKEDTVFLSVYKQLISVVDGSLGGIYVDCGPLNRLDLNSIIENCSELTYVDQTFSFKRSSENEKKALEIGATKLKIDERDRESPEVIDNILFAVSRDLFRATEKGEYTLVLQDSGDCPIIYEEGDVGTLLVCLPNEHKGGELNIVFTATGQECSFQFEPRSGDSTVVQFVALDKGCSYEFKKVTSGYQIILTYTIRRVTDRPDYPAPQRDVSTLITARSGSRRPVSPPVPAPAPSPVQPPEEEQGSVIEVNPVTVPEAKGGCCTIM